MSISLAFIDFSKPFIEAAKSVFETMIYSKLDTLRPTIKKDDLSEGDISAVLGITGEVKRDTIISPFRGMLVISWPTETYCKIASAMLMETHTKYSDEISDVGGEICNMIMGNAKRDLAQMGYTSSMAIPSMIVGRGHNIKYPSGTNVIKLPVTSAHGNFLIELCYQED